MENALVKIAVFENAQQAYLAKARLAYAGINSCIVDEYTATMNWFFKDAIGGIKLKVLESDVDAALEILNHNNDKDEIDAAFSEEGLEPEKSDLKCPYCSSDNISEEKYSKKVALSSILLLGFPLIFRSTKYICGTCFKTWEKE